MHKHHKIRAVQRLISRHKFLLFVEGMVFWLIVAVSLYFLIGYFVVPSIAESQIEKLCGGAATVHSGGFRGFGGVQLKGVLVAGDPGKLDDAPTLQADSVRIRFHPWTILRGRFEVSSVTLSDFLLTADYDSQVKQWCLTDFSFRAEEVAEKSAIPLINLERGALRVRMIDQGIPRTVTTMSVNGQVAKKTAKNEYGFMFETDGRFGYGPSKLQGGLRVGKKEQQNEFWLNGNLQMPAAGILQNVWNLHDIAAECAFQEGTVDLHRLEFNLGQAHAKIDGQMNCADEFAFNLNINFQEIGISEKMRPDTVVYGRMYDYLDPGLTEFLRRFHPSGMSDVKLSVKGGLKDLQTSRLNGLIHCRDISVRDDLFPLSINHLKGDIEFSGRSLTLAGLRGVHGEVELLIQGSVSNFGPETEIDMHTTSQNFKLDEDLYYAISAPTRDPNDAMMWYQISPQGVVEMDYHFQQFSDGKMKQSVRLDLIDVSAMYKFFQYPLQNMTGSLVLESDRIALENIVSKYDNGAQIKIDGQILNYKNVDPNYYITCRGDGIPMNQQLIEAMSPEQQAVFDRMDIEAVVDFNVDVFPNQFNKEIPDFIADVQLAGESFRLEDFPLPMKDIALSAIITRDVVRIDQFDAVTESGRIQLNESTLWPQGLDPNRPGFCANMIVEDFQLNEAFWQAAGPDAENMLGKLRINGPVDANGLLEVNLSKEMCKGNDLTIDCKSNPLEWDSVGLGRVDGQITVQDATVLFTDFVLTDLPLESLPKDIMSETLKKVHESINPRGPVSIRVSEGFIEKGSQGQPKIDLQAEIASQDIWIGRMQPPNRLGGILEGHVVVDANSGYWMVTSHYDIDHFQYENWLVTGLSGEIVHDPETQLLQSNDFQAEFYEGDVKGNLEIDVGDAPGYKLELNYDQVELSKLPALTGTLATNERANNGTASGRVALTGLFDSLSEPRGKFDATIANLEMGRQSLMGKILTAVQLRRPEDYVFHKIELGAEILGPRLVLEKVRILGSPLVFDGTGTIDLKSRQMEIDLSAWDRVVTERQSILDMLARGIGSVLWKVEIRGTLESPKVDAVYLSLLKQPLNIFKKDNAE